MKQHKKWIKQDAHNDPFLRFCKKHHPKVYQKELKKKMNRAENANQSGPLNRAEQWYSM
jgi:hypothetical protein